MIQETYTPSFKIIFVGIIAVLLGVIAPLSTLTAEAREARETRSTRTVADATCMQTAIDTREAALMAAFDTFTTDVKAALTARKSALHDAWGQSDVATRNTDIKNSWKTWKSAHKEAFKDLKTARKSAWDAFKGTVKTTCKADLPKDEALTTDGSGSVSL